MLSIIILIFILIHSILSLTKLQNQVNINLDYGENDTLILFYNISTTFPYLITFRSFGDEENQFKFGLFFATNKSEENSIEIFYHNHTTERFYLFIICFHFILPENDLDIQCNDIRLLKNNHTKTNSVPDFLPTYNPLFVPMMYALSILMLLPVMIQHHRQKQAVIIKRRKQIRRLSITIADDDQHPQQNLAKKLLSQITENGNIAYENVPMETELVSMPSTRTMLDDMNDNTNVKFTHKYDQNDNDEQLGVNADDCIAHLLDNTPWNSPDIAQPPTISLSQQPVNRDSARSMKEQYAPTIITFHDDNDDDDDRKPILKPIKYSSVHLYRTNRVFFESDV